MDVPETVILDLQKKAYERKGHVSILKAKVKTREDDLKSAQSELNYAIIALTELADFLQEHNGTAIDSDSSWRAELGLK